MKKITSILLLGAGLVSCGAPNGGYEINGSYADSTMDSSVVYLMNGDSAVDSAVLVNKAFTFKGDVDSVEAYRLAFKMDVSDGPRYNTLSKVFLEPGTKLDVTLDNGVKLSDNGGVNEIFSKFMEQARKMNEDQMAKYQELMGQQVPQDSVFKVMNEMADNMMKSWSDAITANKDNIVGAALFADFCSNVNGKAEFDSISSTLKYAGKFEKIAEQKKFFDNLDATSEGKMFKDFDGFGMDGKAAKLSDYVGKGKYVLVDFWASWCGPCRHEIPNIMKVNKQFAADNFMVLGVDVWDQEDKFKDAVAEEKIDYALMRTEGQTATDMYGINGIPQIMLFGPDGTILKRGLRGDAIAETVAEYLKK